MKREIIGIDLDTTLNTLNEIWIDHYNKKYNDNLTNDDITDWNIANFVKPKCGNKIYDFLLQPHFFRNLDIQPNAKEVTKWLSQYFNLYIVTAYDYRTCVDKVEWVKFYLPHIKVENIIFVNNKGLIDTDYLIDDRGWNIEVFKNNGIIFDQPYNRYLNDKYDRIYNWLDIKNYFKKYILK